MFWTDLALKKAGCRSREDFQKRYGLRQSGVWDVETCRFLWGWMTGYVNHRVGEGETLYSLAQRYGSQVRDMVFANGLREQQPVPGQVLQIPLPCPVVTADGAFGTDLQAIWTEGLQARYPRLEAKTFGKTAGGRPLTVLRLGRGKRRILMTAAHHGNEYLTGVLLWRLLERYCDGIGRDGGLYGFSARRLLQATSLYLVPLSNPDGVELVTGEIGPDREEYRMAEELARHRPDLPFPRGWKANLRGVDLNLNYPADFDRVKQRKAAAGVCLPGPRDYAGEAPLDQPETRAMAELVEQIQPHALAAWHSQGAEIYAADDRGNLPHGELAGAMARTSGYVLRQVPPESRGGGLRDWFMAKTGRPGFTVEAGRGENPLPHDQLPQLEQENLPIFVLLLHG